MEKAKKIMEVPQPAWEMRVRALTVTLSKIGFSSRAKKVRWSQRQTVLLAPRFVEQPLDDQSPEDPLFTSQNTQLRVMLGGWCWWEKVISKGSASWVTGMRPKLRPTRRLFNTLLPSAVLSWGPLKRVPGPMSKMVMAKLTVGLLPCRDSKRLLGSRTRSGCWCSSSVTCLGI